MSVNERAHTQVRDSGGSGPHLLRTGENDAGAEKASDQGQRGNALQKTSTTSRSWANPGTAQTRTRAIRTARARAGVLIDDFSKLCPQVMIRRLLRLSACLT